MNIQFFLKPRKLISTNLNNFTVFSLYMIFFISSLDQRPCELLPSLGVRRLLAFYIQIYGRSAIKIAHFVQIH